MNASIEPILQDTRRMLDALYGNRLAAVVLYGSQARGDAGPESDVDVLVVLHGSVEVITELKKLAPLQMALLDRYEVMVSLQPYSLDEYLYRESSFLVNVRAEAVPI
jgi:uncharacterized protein